MDSESRNHPPGRSPPRYHDQHVEADAPGMLAPRAQDHWRVNLAEPWEITFWTRELGCSEEQLRSAVQAVGRIAGEVRSHLRDEDQQRRN